MSPRVNFDGIEASEGFELIPEGTYPARIDSAKETIANTGTVGIEVTLKITEGPYQGRLVWDRLWLTPNAMKIVLGKLRACGYPVPSGEFELAPDSLVGRETDVVVRHRPYEGKAQADVAAWKAREGAPVQSAPAPADDAPPF